VVAVVGALGVIVVVVVVVVVPQASQPAREDRRLNEDALTFYSGSHIMMSIMMAITICTPGKG